MVMQKKELCIVHIGMPKTGSSTLQEAFFYGLNDENVTYVNLPHSNQSGWIYGTFCQQPESYHFFIKQFITSKKEIKNFREKTKKLLIDGFENQKSNTSLISGEDLFHFNTNEIELMKKFLNEYFRKVLIVAYVRPVKSFFNSAFQQLVKYHDQGNIDFNKFYHKYKNLKGYDEVFGIENVKLFKFDPSAFPEGDIVLDFCHKMHLKPTYSDNKVVNESLSKEAISILFTYNYHINSKTDFGKKKYMVQNKLVEEISRIGSEKFQFSDKYIARVLENFHDDYAWIKQRMGADFDNNPILVNDGVSTETELMFYSTNYISDLVNIIGINEFPFQLIKHPQTIARLTDILANKIHDDICKKEGI